MNILKIFRNKKRNDSDSQNQIDPALQKVIDFLNDPSPKYVRDLDFDIELGTVVEMEDGSCWCVMAIDHNKQEYRLEGTEIRGNRGETMTMPITELHNTAIYRFSFPHNGIDRVSEPGVEKAIKERRELPPLEFDIFRGE